MKTHLIMTALILATLILPACAGMPDMEGPEIKSFNGDPRGLPMFKGHTGERMGWSEMMEMTGNARVVVVGERHDDAVGHAVELAVVKDMIEKWPRTAVSMEMLERNEQELVDAYLRGDISSDTLAKLAGRRSMGGIHGWQAYYQPLVDAARDRGAHVVAANAPRRYSSLARLEGLDALSSLGRPESRYFRVPRPIDQPEYEERFQEIMESHGDSGNDDKDEEGDEGEDAHSFHSSPEMIDAFFRAQQVWDATMADSILKALWRHRKVVHVVGAFHSDFDGGVVLRLKERRPWLKVMTVSLVPLMSDELREEDRGRADVVIYTGTDKSE